MQQVITINNITFTLADLERDCWHRLLNGAVKGRDPMHLMTIGTLSANFVELRTVVLRKTLPDAKTIIFHTDRRSPKCNDIAANPTVSALLYDHGAKVQLRLQAVATLLTTGKQVEADWQKTNLSSRRSYVTILPPSTPSTLATTGLPDGYNGRELTLQESEAGRENFAVVQLQVLSIDFLHLAAAGHQRAHFTYNKQGTLTGMQWLIP